MTSTDHGAAEIGALGVLGVGEIGQAIIEGLLAIPEGPLSTLPIVLSPRSADRSAALAQRSDRVRVAADNQEVVDAAPVLLLAVPAETADDVLDDLRIPSDRLIISAVAGISIAALRERIGAGPAIVRTIPMPAVRRREGLTPLFPDDERSRALFEGIGEVLVPADEEAFSTFSAVSAGVSAYVEYLATLSAWLVRNGIPEGQAETLVRGIFTGVSGGLAKGDARLPELRRAHETPAGINEQLRETWLDAANIEALNGTLDDVLRRVTQG
jgi:pyrroline-5-carboxylate reductase